MKKCLSLFIFMGFTSIAYADYSAHQFHYMNKNAAECINIASAQAKKYGFSQFNTYGNSNYQTTNSMRKDGYSFQYTCVPDQKYAYMIINGSTAAVRDKLRDNLGEGIQDKANGK